MAEEVAALGDEPVGLVVLTVQEGGGGVLSSLAPPPLPPATPARSVVAAKDQSAVTAVGGSAPPSTPRGGGVTMGRGATSAPPQRRGEDVGSDATDRGRGRSGRPSDVGDGGHGDGDRSLVGEATHSDPPGSLHRGNGGDPPTTGDAEATGGGGKTAVRGLLGVKDGGGDAAVTALLGAAAPSTSGGSTLVCAGAIRVGVSGGGVTGPPVRRAAEEDGKEAGAVAANVGGGAAAAPVSGVSTTLRNRGASGGDGGLRDPSEVPVAGDGGKDGGAAAAAVCGSAPAGEEVGDKKPSRAKSAPAADCLMGPLAAEAARVPSVSGASASAAAPL